MWHLKRGHAAEGPQKAGFQRVRVHLKTVGAARQPGPISSRRHTFGTMLSRAGVAPRVAQAAMRHSSIDLTMNVYTDPRLLDVAGALEALPGLAAGRKPKEDACAIPASM